MNARISFLVLALLAVATVSADEGMWRIGQLPLDTIAKRYGVTLTPHDLERLQNAPVRGHAVHTLVEADVRFFPVQHTYQLCPKGIR